MPRFIFIPDSDVFDTATMVRQVVTRTGLIPVQTDGTLAALTAAAMPHDETIIVIPIARIAFIDALLPRVSAQKRDQLVNFAIEDKLTIDPSTVHAVVIGSSLTGADRFIIAAVSSDWFTNVMHWLQAAGVAPRVALAETALHRINQNEWRVVINGDRGTAIRPDGLAYALDVDNHTEPPFQLMLAINEAVGAESGRAVPKTIRVAIPATDNQIDVTAWQQKLGNQIMVAIEPDHQAVSGLAQLAGVAFGGRNNSGNFLMGRFLPASRAVSAINALKPALALGFVILLLQFVFVAADAWRLDRERRSIDASMRQLFQTSFPEATTIVDPALQMSRNLARLKSERGLGTDPLREAFAAAASITKALPAEFSTAINGVRADTNRLSVTFVSLTTPQRTQLQDIVTLAATSPGAPTGVALDGDTLVIPIGERP